jgi:hypothetical protein
LVSRNPLARFRHQVSNEKPLRKRQMRVVEDCADSYGELVLA